MKNQKIRFIVAGFSLITVTAIFTTSGCKMRKYAAGSTRLRSEAMDLGAQCDQMLRQQADLNRVNGISGSGAFSEESIYRGLFKTVAKVRSPLEKTAEQFASQISEDFLHFSGIVYGRENGGQNFRQARFADGFRSLVRAYVGLLGPRYYSNTEDPSIRVSMLNNNPLGRFTNLLRESGQVAYEVRVGAYLGGLAATRGISLSDLLLVFMMDEYPELFHMGKIATTVGGVRVSSETPSEIISNKTTPALACNNYAAQVIAEPIPWEQLGMSHYQGYGFVPWFHEPIAKFRYEYPVVSGMIPVFGAVMSAGDSLLTAVEGRDTQGNAAGRFESSVFFTFHFTMAVLDAFMVKSVVESGSNMITRITQRARGLEATSTGMTELTAIIKDEAMAVDSAARPFMGREINPCVLTAATNYWSLIGTAYAAGIPCLRGLGDVNALHTNISNGQRLDVIKDVKIADVMSAPGHQYLREPQKVIAISELIKTGQVPVEAFKAEPILLTVFTNTLEDGSVAVRSIEVIDGNHRFAGGLLSGEWKTIGDIPSEFLKIKVNGWNAGGSSAEGRWIPLDVAQKSQIPQQSWFEVPSTWKNVKGPTAQIPGDIASIDAVIPLEYRGVRMEDVLRTSLERANAGNLFPAP